MKEAKGMGKVINKEITRLTIEITNRSLLESMYSDDPEWVQLCVDRLNKVSRISPKKTNAKVTRK